MNIIINTKTTKQSQYRCGFCATESHTRCPGGILNGNRTDVVVCGCNCRPLEEKYRCLNCNSRDNINPNTWNCEDVESCILVVERRVAKERARLYAHRSAEKFTVAKGNTKETHRGTKPKTRDCLCGCANQTKGGMFLPGHDARLLSKTAKDIAGGGTDLKTALDAWESLGISLALRNKLERKVNK